MYIEYNEEENNKYLKDLVEIIDQLPNSLEEARVSKSIYYKPKNGCRNGHLPFRYTSTGRCVACVRKSKKKHFEDNKEKYYKQAVARQNERYKNDPKFRASSLLRDSVKRIFRSIAGNKDKKTFEILGYSVEEFMENISSKFHSGMSWDNHAEVWQLDHVIPMGAFDFTLDAHKVFVNSLENLQPLLLSDHKAKTKLDIRRLYLLSSTGEIPDEWSWLVAAH